MANYSSEGALPVGWLQVTVSKERASFHYTLGRKGLERNEDRSGESPEKFMNFANARPLSSPFSPTSFVPRFGVAWPAAAAALRERGAKMQRDAAHFRRALAMKRSLREMKVIGIGDSCPVAVRFFSFARAD